MAKEYTIIDERPGSPTYNKEITFEYTGEGEPTQEHMAEVFFQAEAMGPRSSMLYSSASTTKPATKSVEKKSLLPSDKVAYAQTWGGEPVAPKMPTSVSEMGTPDPTAGVHGAVKGAVEGSAAFVTGIPSMFVNLAISTPAKLINASINKLLGSKEPFLEARQQVESIIQAGSIAYEPGKEGRALAKGATWGMIAVYAPYLLPVVAGQEALETEWAEEQLRPEDIERLRVASDMIFLLAPMVKQYGPRVVKDYKDYHYKKYGGARRTSEPVRSAVDYQPLPSQELIREIWGKRFSATIRQANESGKPFDVSEIQKRTRKEAIDEAMAIEKERAMAEEKQRLGKTEWDPDELQAMRKKHEDRIYQKVMNEANAAAPGIKEVLPAAPVNPKELSALEDGVERTQGKVPTARKKELGSWDATNYPEQEILSWLLERSRKSAPEEEAMIREWIQRNWDKESSVVADHRALVDAIDRIQNKHGGWDPNNYSDQTIYEWYRDRGGARNELMEAELQRWLEKRAAEKRHTVPDVRRQGPPEMQGAPELQGPPEMFGPTSFPRKGELRQQARVGADRTAQQNPSHSQTRSPNVAVAPAPVEKTWWQRNYDLWKERIRTFLDKHDLNQTPAMQRFDARLANAASYFGNARNSFQSDVDYIISEVFPESREHMPSYIWDKVRKLEEKYGRESATAHLSKRERSLYDQAVRRNTFGRMLVYDRILNIYFTANLKAREATTQMTLLQGRLKELQNEYGRYTKGKMAVADQSIVNRLEKDIAMVEAGITETNKIHEYQTKKARDVQEAHDLSRYSKYVREKMVEFESELVRYRATANRYFDDLYDRARGSSVEPDWENVGFHTKARVNLIVAGEGSAEWHTGQAVQNKQSMGTGRVHRKTSETETMEHDTWDREAKGTGSYTTSLYSILGKVAEERKVQAAKLEFFNALKETEGGVFINANDKKTKRPKADEYKQWDGIINLPIVDLDTKKVTLVPHELYVRKDIFPEVRQLLTRDESIFESRLGSWITEFQMASGTDLVAHTMNIMSQVTRQVPQDSALHRTLKMVPGVATVGAGTRLSKYIKEAYKETPEYLQKKQWMHENGLLRDAYHTSKLIDTVGKAFGHPKASEYWTGHFLLKLDTAARMYLNDVFDSYVSAGKFVDTMVNRRNFIQQVGNYNGRLMPYWASMSRRHGATFIVAGRTFTRNALRAATGHPGAQTTGMGTEVALRAENIARPVLALSMAGSLNYWFTGDPKGRPGTPPGAIDYGAKPDEKGKFPTIQVLPKEFERFLSTFGGRALYQGMRGGLSTEQIGMNIVHDTALALSHPVVGPQWQAAYTAVSGRDLSGRPVAKEAGSIGRIKASLEKTNPAIYNAMAGEGKEAAKAFLDPFVRVSGYRKSQRIISQADQMIFDASMKFELAMTQEQKEKQELILKSMQSMKEAGWQKPDDDRNWQAWLLETEGGKALRKAMLAEKITPKEIRDAFSSYNLTDRQRKFKNHIGLNDALKIFAAADQDEKKELGDILYNKLNTFVTRAQNERDQAEENGDDEMVEYFETKMAWGQEMYDKYVNGNMTYDPFDGERGDFYDDAKEVI